MSYLKSGVPSRHSYRVLMLSLLLVVSLVCTPRSKIMKIRRPIFMKIR